MDKDLERINKKMDTLLEKIHELDKKVVTQDHLTHRISNLERNQYFVVTAVIGGIIKMLMDYFSGGK